MDIERYKALFVVQGHKDREKDYLIHASKIVHIRNIDLLITLAAIYRFEVCNQYVPQDHIQGDNISQKLYVNPTSELQLPKDHYLNLLNPLSVLSESGDSWLHKYNNSLLNVVQ